MTNKSFQDWVNQNWERLFSKNISSSRCFLLATLVAFSGFAICKFLYASTGTYFTLITIITVVIISLFAKMVQALFFAVILSIANDYFLIPPIGGIFENRASFEHFFVICSTALFSAILVSSLRSAFQNTSLAKQQAQQAKQQAERSSLIMENMLALVSHDVRNPLTAIKIKAQLIQKYPDQIEKHRELSNSILKTLDRVDGMIQTLLDVARIRSGKKIPMDFRYCDLSLQVASFVEELKIVFSDRVEFVEAKPYWGNWGVEGIQRALENLVTNALKYGDTTTAIKIILKDENDAVTLSVHNQGNEIDAKDQANLFNPFCRLDVTENSPIKGWGLGLTLVKGVAEVHGGKVQVDSRQGFGTTFTLKLPAKGKHPSPAEKDSHVWFENRPLESNEAQRL